MYQMQKIGTLEVNGTTAKFRGLFKDMDQTNLRVYFDLFIEVVGDRRMYKLNLSTEVPNEYKDYVSKKILDNVEELNLV